MNRRATMIEIALIVSLMGLGGVTWLWLIKVIAHYLRCPYA